MAEDALPVRFISQYELNGHYERMLAHYHKSGIELIYRIKRNGTPRPDFNQPPGTRSIVELAIDPGSMTVVATTHFFRLPDGVTIGGSGKKDPKRVVFDRIDYRVRNTQPSGSSGSENGR